jgi:hypothetical protein
MAQVEYIKAVEQLKKYLNKDGFLEVAIRGKNKKFKVFQKLSLSNLMESETKEKFEQLFSAMDKNNKMAKKTQNMVKNVAKLQKLNMVFGALNLCATCAGFAVMYMKLDKMCGQINQVMGTVKQGQDISANYEFHKVLSEHSNMLDARKTQKYYTEEQMRQLVDSEYNVLTMLIEGFMKDHTDDKKNLVDCIYSMAAMMTVSLKYFDELYYLNNKDVIGDGDIWHSSHNNWTGILEKMLSDEFVEKIQDMGVFDLGLTMNEADVFYLDRNDQIQDMLETIADNQTIIVALGSAELMSAYEEYVDQEVSDSIRETIDQVEGFSGNTEAVEIYRSVMKQMALEV